MSEKTLRQIALSLGVSVLFAAPALAQFAPNTPNRSNIRIPPNEDPQASDESTQRAEGQKFACELVDGQYTVMYYPDSQSNQGNAWATPSALGGGWTPERRCNEISRRLESYRPDGLQELSTDRVNNYDIVCVTTQANPACRIVFTVPPGQDAKITRDRVFENLTVADSGQQTDAVNTFVDGGGNNQILRDILGVGSVTRGGSSNSNQRPQFSPDSINLRPFLSPADGGTGRLLR